MSKFPGSNYKAPPAMRDGLKYEDWKKEFQIWQAFTELEEKRQGGALFLTLSGKSREAVLANVAVDAIKETNGVAVILLALDNLFLKDKAESGFDAFDEFIGFRRPQSMSIEDYVIEFNLKYNKIRTYEMTLPEGVQAYALLKCANLTSDQQQLCRATCKTLTYKDMKTQIERISAVNSNTNRSTSKLDLAPTQFMSHEIQYDEPREQKHYPPPETYEEECDEFYPEIEPEPTYYSQPYRPSQPRYRRGATNFRQQPSTQQYKLKPNPPDQYGNPTPCRFCRSIYHWIDDCPVAPQRNNSSRNTRGTDPPSRPRTSQYGPQRRF